MDQGTSNKPLIIGVVAIAVLIFAGLTWAILTAPSSGPIGGNATFTDSADAPFVGPSDASVVVHMYGDFQCPACKAAEPGLKAAMEAFKDRVKFVWKDFPLMSIHPNARNGANAARCAQDQGKFWEMHDALYANQESWSGQSDPGPSFAAYGQQIGLDGTAFTSCYEARKKDAIVMADVAEGNRNGVTGTPTFFVNQSAYVGLAANQWTPTLTAALAAATTTQ